MLNESLILNPCANLNTETHSKLIYAISQSDYFDPEDWDEFTTNVVLRDFGDDGIRSCTSFMMTSPDQRKEKDSSVISDKDYDQIKKFKSNSSLIEIGNEHNEYSHSTKLSDRTVKSLSADFN